MTEQTVTPRSGHLSRKAGEPRGWDHPDPMGLCLLCPTGGGGLVLGDPTSRLRPHELGQRACRWIQTEAGSQAPGWDKSVPGDLGGAWPRPGRGGEGALGIAFHPHRPPPRYLAKLSSVGSISEEETCEKLKGLIQRQVQMCKRNLEVMDSVRRGAQLAIEECQYQFRNRRWNCSTLDSLPVFGKVVTQGEGGLAGVLGQRCGVRALRGGTPEEIAVSSGGE